MKLRKLKFLSFVLVLTMVTSGLGLAFHPNYAHAQDKQDVSLEQSEEAEQDLTEGSNEDPEAVENREVQSANRGDTRELEAAEFRLKSNYAPKLYKYSDADLTTDLLEGVEADGEYYRVQLEAGDYLLQVYYGENLCGTMKIVVTKEGEPKSVGDMHERNHFEVLVISGFAVRPSDWVEGEDYTAEYSVMNNKATFDRESVMGIIANGNKGLLALDGDNIKATYTPDPEKHPDYLQAYTARTVNWGFSNFPMTTIPQGAEITLSVPKGAQVDFGRLHTYFVFDFQEPTAVDTSAEDKDVFTFKAAKNQQCFYRVKMDDNDAVTYWNYKSWREPTSVEVTEEDLHIGDDYNADTVYRNFEKTVYDLGDIYLNINEKGYMNMEAGDTFTINALRNWFLVESFSNSQVALPDFEYKVIDFEGNASDVVSIEPNEKNSGEAVLKAEKDGTAVVLVTYDSVTHQTSGMGKEFGAIWPERTGVFVVSVGNDGTAIDTGMTINADINYNENADLWEKLCKDRIDAEQDIIFYTGSEGGKYSFEPEEDCTVEVARPTLTDDSLTYSGFSQDGISEKDGEFTVSGLKTGRNIIKVTKGDVSSYQVITAQKVSYKLLDATSEEEISEVAPGQSVIVQFAGLTNPSEKLSGIYNFNAKPHYVGEDGTQYNNTPGGFGSYGFSGSSAQQRLTVEIPEDWDQAFYHLSEGNIKMGGFGDPAGNHRSVTYAKGRGQNFSARSVNIYLGELPDIRIPIEGIAKKVEVSFEAEGHEDTPESLEVYKGDLIDNPGELAREGYIFEGWFKDAEGTEAFDFENDTVESDITLYAKWKAETFEVTFDAQGHGEAPDSQEIAWGEHAEEPEALTAEGYIFEGWFKDAEFTEAFDFENDAITSDITLYAKWEQEEVVPEEPGEEEPGEEKPEPEEPEKVYVHVSVNNINAFYSKTMKAPKGVKASDLKWKPWNKDLASVNRDGKVYAKKAGVTRVVAEKKDKDKITQYHYFIRVLPGRPTLSATKSGRTMAKLKAKMPARSHGVKVYRAKKYKGKYNFKLYKTFKTRNKTWSQNFKQDKGRRYGYYVRAYRVMPLYKRNANGFYKQVGSKSFTGYKCKSNVYMTR